MDREMKNDMKAQLGLAVVCALALTACGGGDSSSDDFELRSSTDSEPDVIVPNNSGGGDPVPDTDGGSPPPSGIVSPVGAPHTIALTYPVSESVENLGGGVYRRIVSAIVTGSQGIAVNDGTVIELRVIDSVLAAGNLAGSGDSASGATLTDNDVVLADGVTSTGFDMAYALRNDAVRFIEEGDHLYLISADEEDKSRTVAQAPDSNVSLSVSSPYNRDYPNEDYDGDPAPFSSFRVGASLLGANVLGEINDEDELANGVAITKEGIATFFITYPANVTTILSGCGGIPFVDERSEPIGSAIVYLAANVQNNENVTAVSNDFCFTAIDGGEVIADLNSTNEKEAFTVDIEVTDGGDGVLLPYILIEANVVDDDSEAGVFLIDPITGSQEKHLVFRNGKYGSTQLSVVGEPGSTATITFGVGGEFEPASVDVEVPEDAEF